MKHLMLISLLCLLAACGGNGKKSPSHLGAGQTNVNGSAGEVIVPVIVVTEETPSTVVDTEETEETAPSVVDTEETPSTVVDTEETEETAPTVVDSEETAPTVVDNEETAPAEAMALVCDFSNVNEQASFSLSIKSKSVVLKDLEKEGKVTFDRYIFSPSGNENAAVKHEDKNFSVEEGKVLKITARIVMSEDLKTGELQVSYKVKTADKKTIQLDFRKLADINNCK